MSMLIGDQLGRKLAETVSQHDFAVYAVMRNIATVSAAIEYSEAILNRIEDLENKVDSFPVAMDMIYRSADLGVKLAMAHAQLATLVMDAHDFDPRLAFGDNPLAFMALACGAITAEDYPNVTGDDALKAMREMFGLTEAENDPEPEPESEKKGTKVKVGNGGVCGVGVVMLQTGGRTH